MVAVHRDARRFVGRAQELERLRELAAVALRMPAAALIVAEPGLGKTRLLEEFAPELGRQLVELQGYESARDVPLATAATLLRTLSAAPKSGERLDGILLGETDASQALEKVRLFETAYRCLAELVPLTILVDDLQWTDQETLSLLHYLVTAAEGVQLPLLLLVAARPSSAASSWTSDLVRLLGPQRCGELRLGPLGRDEAGELMANLAPDLADDETERLLGLAQGSPFWLQALTGGHRVGTTPADLVSSRLAGLDSDASCLFALLVVAARPLTATGAAELLGWKQARAQRAATLLENRALVLQEADSLRVAHDLIRETARGQVPEQEQRRLHGLLASWLESRAAEDVRELFHALEHRQAAGMESMDLAARIAGSQQRRLLGVEGLLTLGAIADAASGAAGEMLQLEVAMLASDLGEWQAAFERWAALANRLPVPRARARAALAAAASAFRLGQATEVHAFATRARKAAAGEVIAIEADVHEAEAMLWLEGRGADAQPLVQRAATAARGLVTAGGGVDALADPERNAFVRTLRAELDAAIRAADAVTVARCAAEMQTAARDPVEALAAASDGVFSLLQFEGMPAAAEPQARRLLEQSRRLALPSLEVEATQWVGWIAGHRGRLEEAASHLARTIELAGRVGPPRRFTLRQLQALAHGIEASRGDWRAHVGAIEAAIVAEPDPHYRLIIRNLHIWLLGRFGSSDANELARLLRPLTEDAELAGCDRCFWESVLYAAEAQARSGRLAAAADAVERWDAAHPAPHGGPGARRTYVRALLVMHRDPEASLPLFEEAAALASAVGYELMRLWIELDAATALARVDRPAGVAALREAARSAEAIGARSEQSLAVQRLRALGVRTWRRHGDVAPLTARELEIAQLVAAGDSNPEIAAALFLSRKTVERHVSNVLRKVGARNRTELAARLPRNPQDGGAAR